MLIRTGRKDYLTYLGGSSQSPTDGLGPAGTILDILEDELHEVDCGLEFRLDGGYNYPNFSLLNGRKVKTLLRTHAHTDHVGSEHLAYDLNAFDESTRILGTPQTNQIVPMVLETTFKHLGFNYHSLAKVEQATRVLPYGEFELSPHIDAFTHEAGHTPGAAYVIYRIKRTGKKIAFMGDHSWDDQDVVGPSSFPDDIPDEWLPDTIAQIDLTNAKLESSNYQSGMDGLTEHVKKCLGQKKIVLIFTFANTREQNVAIGLRDRGIYPIYCDGMGATIFDIFHKNRWSPKDKEFSLDGLEMITGGQRQREELAKSGGPLVICAPSGFADQGSAVRWLKLLVEREDVELIGVSWAPPGSRLTVMESKINKRNKTGRPQLIKISGEYDDDESGDSSTYQLKCDLTRFHLSGHSGLDKFILSLKKIRSRREAIYGLDKGKMDRIVTTHGLQRSKDLVEKYLSHFAYEIVKGNVGTSIEI